jgi:hypothetical protein
MMRIGPMGRNFQSRFGSCCGNAIYLAMLFYCRALPTLWAPASLDGFHQFVLALEEKDVEVTNANIGGLFPLSDVFGFWSV